jgi:hypothetical protein
MKKISFTFIFLLAFLAISHSLSADCLPNPSFEQWTSSGSEPPFDWEEPTDWSTLNAWTEFISSDVDKVSDAKSGNYAAYVQTFNIFGTYLVPGMLCTGKISADFNYNIDLSKIGCPCSEKPTSLSGWYKFSSTDAEDNASVIVALKKYNTAEDRVDTVAYGFGLLPPISSYTEFTVNFNYLIDDTPDSLIVIIASSNLANPKEGGKLYIDDLSLSPTSDVDDISKNNTILLYPNPSNGKINFEFDGNEEISNYSLMISDLNGKLVKTIESLDSADINLGLPSGSYFYTLVDQRQNRIVSGKLNIIR